MMQYPNGKHYSEISRLKADIQEQEAVRQAEERRLQAEAEQRVQRELQTDFIPMVYVAGGTFTMGCTSEQGGDCYDNESPAHRVTLSSYYIGKYEVTQAQWKAVMGSNPSYFEGDNLPVERVTWNAVQEFIRKLNQQTSKNYRLPTEAEWEFAARGGTKSNGYKYSGSNTAGNVAWYYENAGDYRKNDSNWSFDEANKNKTHPVGTKSPNELGIYDMSGNVWEWCNDWYDTYSSGSQTNPRGASTGSYRVYRGGGWGSDSRSARVSPRNFDYPNNRFNFRGFRLACDLSSENDNLVKQQTDEQKRQAEEERRLRAEAEQRRQREAQEAQRQRKAEQQRQADLIPMVYVAGGTFTMGCTSEQGGDCYDNESPAHRVTLSSYYIGKTEVTQAQWKAVMGGNPSNWKGDNLPVEQVSWNDVQEFIRKLNAQTGKNYRLPTEAEWEFAARGGNQSRGYIYSGSNTIGSVAWYYDNSYDNSSKTHPVGTKSPNELGIYNMSGNVYEWCNDWYGSYSSVSQTNPRGASSGSYRVLRGGSWGSDSRGTRVSARGSNNPGNRYFISGFRLAMDAE
jgi:formylglycine-generating enzyme required for sulfatase activity